jgi:hypothetical protein
MAFRLRVFVIAATLAGLTGTDVGAEPKAVLELFTSQGCSSCPPADALFGEYAGRDDIVALSLPVDYWNYLGWEDTLASHQNTERQRGYAAARGDRQVYTPQVVVDGSQHVVGSDRGAIDAAIEAGADTLKVPVSLSFTDDAMTVTIGASPDGQSPRSVVWLVLYDRAHTVEIGSGENDGRTVTYYNVVREMRRLAMWKGEAITVDLPMLELKEAAADGCAAIVQQETRSGLPGPILGAAIYEGAPAAGPGSSSSR